MDTMEVMQWSAFNSSGECSEAFIESSTDPLLPSVSFNNGSAQVASTCRASEGKVENLCFFFVFSFFLFRDY